MRIDLRGMARVGVVLLSLLPGCTTDVLHDLDEPSANASVAALAGAGLAAEKALDESTTGGSPRFALRVPTRETARALEILRQQGLPREPRTGFAELYGRPGLIPSELEERARFVLATTGEVERTLESVEGVVSARVHLVPAEPDPAALDGRDRSPARAAVLVRVRPGASLGLTTGEIQKLVAGSAPGLDPAAVVVIATATAPPRPPGDDGGGSGGGGSTSALAALGPFWVARASRGPLIVTAIVALVVIGLLAVLVLVTLRPGLRSALPRSLRRPGP
jgi:type III secretion protein J